MRLLGGAGALTWIVWSLVTGESIGGGASETDRSALYFGLCSSNVSATEITDGGRQRLPVIVFTLTVDGRREFFDLTSHNVGRELDVVFDGVSLGKNTIRAAVESGFVVSREWRSHEAAVAFASLVRDDSNGAPCGSIEEPKNDSDVGAQTLDTSGSRP
jgi:preprotein translocase subunit SecD